jgi:hypothetical protein
MLTNDTLNGAAVTTSNTNVTALTLGPLSIDTNGNQCQPQNNVERRITNYAKLVGASPANCDTATATVVVNNPIDAVIHR